MKLSKTAEKVINLARQVQDYWNTELPKRHPNYPFISPEEESAPPPPEQAKLIKLLASLPKEDIQGLVFLMFLGRGDFGTDDLATHYAAVKERVSKPVLAVSQMVGKVPLADYLEDGIGELKRVGIDVDNLAFTSAKVRK
ncbi:MAG TPA: DUF3775 domain-containing protein [Planctomycetaceae bacterium]|jgi:hypothetical protein|nr:DUF3775 domain-containing protein [Planctomycetaceae bacterium]